MMRNAISALLISAVMPSPAAADSPMIIVGPTVTIAQTGHVLIDVAYQCFAGNRAFLSATVSEADRTTRNYTFGHSPANPAYSCDGDYRTVTLVASPEDNQVFKPGQGHVNADISVCDRLFNCDYRGQTTQKVNLVQAK
jgi:hypothetical protein